MPERKLDCSIKDLRRQFEHGSASVADAPAPVSTTVEGIAVEIASRINNQVLDWGFSIPRTAFEYVQHRLITGGIQLE